MNINIDSYALRARIWPVLLAMLPALLVTGTWLPLSSDRWRLVVGAVFSSGLWGLLEHLGRERGARCQTDLFRAWGGAPTTRLLRHADSTLNCVTKSRYHPLLGRAMSLQEMPTPASEAQDPEGADRIYESCGQLLRARTRNKSEHPLVFAKNVEYGFRRNCLGLRRPAMWIGVLSVLAAMASLISPWHSPSDDLASASIVLGCLLLLWWAVTVKPLWVKPAADAYAEALLGTIDTLESRDASSGALHPPRVSDRPSKPETA